MTFRELGIDHKKSSGIEYVLCPKCSHLRKNENKTKPCLNLNHHDNWWKCHNCDWSGNLKSFERTENIKEKSGYQEAINSYSPEFIKYWEERKISEKTLKKAHCYERKLAFPHINKDVLISCANFPIYRDYNLVNVKVRSLIGKGIRQIKKEDGGEKHYIGWERWNDQCDYCVIVEGEPDMLSAMEIGLDNVLSVPDGAPNADSENIETKMSFHNEYAIKKFRTIKKFYLALDDDSNGIRLRDELARRLGKLKCRIVTYSGCKDLNELLVSKDEESCKNEFKNCKSYPIEGIITVNDIREELLNFRRKGFERGQLIGIPDIDRIYSVKPKLMTVSTGYPGSGKSTWWRWYLTELIKYNKNVNNHIIVYSPEDRPLQRTIALIAQIYAKKRYKYDEWNSMSDIDYNEALDWINNHFTFLSPFDMKRKKINFFGREISAPNSHDGILELSRVCVEQKGSNILLIDSYAKFDHQRGNSTETDYISKMLDNQLEFNDKYDVHSIFIAHPKSNNDCDALGNHSKLPSLRDISGGAHWDNKADTGLTLGRNKWTLDSNDQIVKDVNSPTMIKTVKHKFLEIGEEGIAKMWMDYWAGESFTTDPIKRMIKSNNKQIVRKEIEKQKESNAWMNQARMPYNESFDDELNEMPF